MVFVLDFSYSVLLYLIDILIQVIQISINLVQEETNQMEFCIEYFQFSLEREEWKGFKLGVVGVEEGVRLGKLWMSFGAWFGWSDWFMDRFGVGFGGKEWFVIFEKKQFCWLSLVAKVKWGWFYII